MPHAHAREKLILSLIIRTFLLGIVITLQCRIFTPAEYETTADIELHPVPDFTTNADNTYYITDSIAVVISTRHTEETDSVVCRTSVTDQRYVIRREEMNDSDMIHFRFDYPCTVTVYADNWSEGIQTTTDSITLYLLAKKGSNRKPEIEIVPVRRYASTTLPCTLSVAFNDSDFWQTMSPPEVEGVDPEKIQIRDSLVIFTPDSTDTGTTITLRIRATDSGYPPASDTQTVTLALLDDGERLPPPSAVSVVERTGDAVTLSWDPDSLGDGYTVYRSLDIDRDEWDSIASVTTPTFTDRTDTVFFYRVVTDNYFGSSEPGAVVLGSDTLHYGHAIGFQTEHSVASENDSVHTIAVKVAKAAKEPITVRVSAKGRSTGDSDFTLLTSDVEIAEGDTLTEVRLRITDDEDAEPPETLTVSIDSVSSGFAAGVLVHTVIIADNDTFNTVTYNGNGAEEGSVPKDTGAYRRGETVTVPGNTGNLKREGHTFTLWNTSADGKGAGYAAGATLVMNGLDVVLYAQWTTNPTYRVSYEGNGGTSGDPPVDENNYEKGMKATVREPVELAKTGFTFTLWNTRANGTGTDWEVDSVITMGGEDLILYAQWSRNSYTVTYNGNENTAGNPPGATTVKYQDSVTVKGNTGDLKKTGYVFEGWNSAEDGTGDDYPADTTFAMGAGDLTLYAKWTPDKFAVTWHGNGNDDGSTPPDTSCYYGAEFTVAGNNGSMTKEGYEFAGWNTDENGEGTSLPGDTTITMGAGALELYAQWKIKTYPVTFHDNGSDGGEVPEKLEVPFGDSATVPGAGSAYKTGYSFVGWSTREGTGGTVYSEGQKFKMPDGEVPLYAQWKIETYSVVYDGNGNDGGDVPAATTHEYKASVTVKGNENNLSKTGHGFDGWCRSRSGEGDIFTPGSSFNMGAGNDTLFAKWTPNSYTVTFNTQGGSDVGPQTVSYGSHVNTPSSPVISNCTFSYWYYEPQCFNKWNFDTDVIVSDATLYAGYTVSDIEGNVYKTVLIGNQRWMAENLKTTKLNDGTMLSLIEDNDEWTNSINPGYCWYDNDAGVNNGIYGGIYNYYAIGTGRLAPEGWHLPGRNEWGTLESYLMQNGYGIPTDYDIAKSLAAQTAWKSDGEGSIGYDLSTNNGSGFSALPGGSRNWSGSGIFSGKGIDSHWWGSMEYDDIGRFDLFNSYSSSNLGSGNTNDGFYVRCIYGIAYIVDFDDEGGNTITLAQTIKPGDNVKEPRSPTRTGYIFAGWFKESECINQWNFSNDVINSSLTLYTKWNRIYTVTFDGRSATTSPDPSTIQVIEPATTVGTLPAAPSKTGCTFAGWYTGIVGSGTEFTANTPVNDNLTVYALWTMTDSDNNVYKTVTIGTQVWMAENLKTTKYRDGTAIPLVIDAAAWEALATPGYCWYENNESYKEPYGALYNWYTVNTGNVAPAGWHVPSDAEWTELENYLIANGYNYDSSITGNKIAKSLASTTNWNSFTGAGTIGNNLSLNNRSGFSALPGGSRGNDGTFSLIGINGYWWSGTEYDAANAWYRHLGYYDTALYRNDYYKRLGFSVRCVRN